jgi:DNA-binding response OmpR family regulator
MESNLKIDQLFLISANDVMRKTIDIWGKEQSFKVFTIDNLEEATHFFDDMKPDFLVIDCDELAMETISEFVNERATEIPVAYINGEGEMALPRPLQLENLLKDLDTLYDKFTK